MLCKCPGQRNGKLHACGQCMPCRIKNARVWAHRLMLEGDCHEHKAFVTLTYDDEHLPSDGSLPPKKFIGDWFKIFRECYRQETGRSLRFYCVGEYGDKSFRPHYHFIIFGYPPCENEYRKKWLRKQKKGCDCYSCSFVQRIWGRGFTDVGTVSLQSTRYVAGYVTKKMTKSDDIRLEGRMPEYSNMSRKPYGIGAMAIPFIEDALVNPVTGELELDEFGDVPTSLKCDGKSMPLGRYMRRKLQDRLGVTDEVREKKIHHWQEEMRVMLANDPLSQPKKHEIDMKYFTYSYEIPGMTLKEFLVHKHASKIAKMERIHKQQTERKTI